MRNPLGSRTDDLGFGRVRRTQPHGRAVDRQSEAAKATTESAMQVDETEVQPCRRRDPDMSRGRHCVTGCTSRALHGSIRVGRVAASAVP